MNLKDILSYLSYRQACKLLGPAGEQLIRAGGKYEIDIGEQVVWGGDFFKLNLGETTVAIAREPGKPRRLNFTCSACRAACEHTGAAFSLILEEKLALGLSAPPPERQPVESISDKELIKQAIE